MIRWCIRETDRTQASAPTKAHFVAHLSVQKYTFSYRTPVPDLRHECPHARGQAERITHVPRCKEKAGRVYPGENASVGTFSAFTSWARLRPAGCLETAFPGPGSPSRTFHEQWHWWHILLFLEGAMQFHF